MAIFVAHIEILLSHFRLPPVPDRTEEYGVNKPLPDMSQPLKQIYTCEDCGEMYQGFQVGLFW